MSDSDHKSVVQQEFTRQADAYAVAPTVSDPERIARLVAAVAPSPQSRLLDVACGPGFLALAFAPHCREVIGVDLTDAPLAIAERNRKARGLNHVSFQLGDADQLPFADGEFDVAVSRFALHHMEDPARVLFEMTRVCRPQGIVAMEDLVTSENQGRGDYQNHVERLRDPSHTRALASSELIQVVAAAGLEIERVYSGETTQSVELWLANSQTPPDRANEVRALIERDARENLSGMRAYKENGRWYFRHITLAIVGRKIRKSSQPPAR